VLIISALLPIENAGFYNIALSWIGMAQVIFPTFIVLPVLSSLVSRGTANLQDGFNYFFRYLLFLLVPVSFLLAFFAKYLLAALYTPQYAVPASAILSVLAFSVMFNGIVAFMALLFNSVEKVDTVAKIYALGAVLNIALNFSLIPVFGVLGAAYSNIIVYACLSAVFIMMAKPAGKINVRILDFARPFFASALVFACLISLPAPSGLLHAIIYVLLAAIAYVAIQFAIRGISVSEIKFLFRRIFSKQN
jgi:O-antigen/teichoic acid export membrane protein